MYNRSYAVEIEKGKEYEFVVTATNKYGESSMEQDVKRIKVLDGRCINNYFSEISLTITTNTESCPLLLQVSPLFKQQTSSSTSLFVQPFFKFFSLPTNYIKRSY